MTGGEKWAKKAVRRHKGDSGRETVPVQAANSHREELPPSTHRGVSSGVTPEGLEKGPGTQPQEDGQAQGTGAMHSTMLLADTGVGSRGTGWNRTQTTTV